jgi:hypothetical protein
MLNPRENAEGDGQMAMTVMMMRWSALPEYTHA